MKSPMNTVKPLILHPRFVCALFSAFAVAAWLDEREALVGLALVLGAAIIESHRVPDGSSQRDNSQLVARQCQHHRGDCNGI